jgi:cob(I)alamin adenosyltransferase
MPQRQAKPKTSTTVVYTGNGKGKTSASLGLLLRALGAGRKVALIQFIKSWETSEDRSIDKFADLYPNQLFHYKGGLGFYYGDDGTDETESHRSAASKTYQKAFSLATSGEYDLVICDELSNAVHDNLLDASAIEKLLLEHHDKTSVCITGRNFPRHLLPLVDTATEFRNIRSHYDNGAIPTPNIDF